MRHTISVLVENKFGVLTRVAGLFSGRGYNIDTLNVAPTHQANASRMTIVTRGDDATLDQIVKQLNKLVNVIEVHDYSEADFIDRELILVRVAVNAKTRAEIMQMTDIFRAKIVDVQPKAMTIEITGDESKIDKFLALMSSFGVLELSRTVENLHAKVHGVHNQQVWSRQPQLGGIVELTFARSTKSDLLHHCALEIKHPDLVA